MNPKPDPPPKPPQPARHLFDAATAAEIRGQSATPENRHAGDEDQQLSRLLKQLPDATMPSGFTHHVLQALDQHTAAALSVSWHERLRAWIAQPNWNPRLVATTAVLLLVPTLWIGHRLSRGQQLVSSVAAITRPVQEAAQATRLPPVQILQDFEAIDQMRRLSALADEELLASLESAGP